MLRHAGVVDGVQFTRATFASLQEVLLVLRRRPATISEVRAVVKIVLGGKEEGVTIVAKIEQRILQSRRFMRMKITRVGIEPTTSRFLL